MSNTPVKRTKGHDGRPRPSGRLPANTPTSSPDRTTAYDTIIVENNQRYPTLLEARRSTSVRTPTRADLIHDALNKNPKGLCSNDVSNWILKNRPDAYREGDEEKLKADVRKALSAHSRKTTPTVTKVGGSGRSHSIWKLARVEGQTPRSSAPTDPSRDEVEETHDLTPASASPQCHLRRAETRSTTPAAVQGYDNRSNDQSKKPEAGSGEVCEEGEDENVLSDTNHNTGDPAHQPPHMSLKSSTTTNPELPVAVQPRTHAPDDVGIEAVITIQSPGALDTGEPRKTSNESEEACNSDPEAVLRYGKLVLGLNRMRSQRDLSEQKIAADRNALPDIKDMDKNVEQAMQKVAELERMLEEAHQTAASACSARDATITKMGEIETAEQELEQLVAEHEILRAELAKITD